MNWDMWLMGLIAGVSSGVLITYPIAYHRGWLAGYARHKNIMRGGD